MFSQGKPNSKPIIAALLVALSVPVPAFAADFQITGDMTYNYGHMSRNGHGYHASLLETCLYINGQLDDNWSVNARIQNDQDFTNSSFEGKTEINQYWIQRETDEMKLVVGKAPQFLVNGNVYDDSAKMVSFTYGELLKFNTYYGEPEDFGFDRFYGASITADLVLAKLSIGYDKFAGALTEIKDLGVANNIPEGKDNAIWNVTASQWLGDVTLTASYLNSDFDDGYVVGATYKRAELHKPHSFGIRANWYDQGNGTYVVHTMYGDKDMTGFKGYMVAADYTVSKNVVATVEYYNLENKADKSDMDTIWSKLMFAF